MIIISHRGNLLGPNPITENLPAQILHVKQLQYFYVEVDIWKMGSKWFLGHDYQKYEINEDFFNNLCIIYHCKNLEALNNFTEEIRFKYPKVEYFWHERDSYTLTSKNRIWAYPNRSLNGNGITVLTKPDDGTHISINKLKNDIGDFDGICTDYPIYYFNLLREYYDKNI